MGKRELLLIAVFGLVGLAVYQFTAPPARPGQEGFSIGRAWQHIRTEIQGEAALAENRSTTTGAVAAGIDELVLAETRGTITVLGEPRSDVLVEVRAEVSGSDQPEAERRAQGMTAQVVPGGPSLRLTVPIPSGARRYRVDMTVHIPSRLGVRADGLRGQLNVRGAAAVKLNVRGDAVIKDIAGTVEGEHRGGDVEISGARAVRLETRGSDVRLESIGGDVALSTVDGRVRVRVVSGQLRLDGRRTDVDADAIAGEIDVTDSDASIRIAGARKATRIEGHRSGVMLQLAAPAGASVSTSDDHIELVLPPSGGIALDAIAVQGEIRADDAPVQVTGDQDERRASGPVRGGGPTVTLRTTRGDIKVRIPRQTS